MNDLNQNDFLQISLKIPINNKENKIYKRVTTIYHYTLRYITGNSILNQ